MVIQTLTTIFVEIVIKYSQLVCTSTDVNLVIMLAHRLYCNYSNLTSVSCIHQEVVYRLWMIYHQIAALVSTRQSMLIHIRKQLNSNYQMELLPNFQLVFLSFNVILTRFIGLSVSKYSVSYAKSSSIFKHNLVVKSLIGNSSFYCRKSFITRLKCDNAIKYIITHSVIYRVVYCKNCFIYIKIRCHVFIS